MKFTIKASDLFLLLDNARLFVEEKDGASYFSNVLLSGYSKGVSVQSTDSRLQFHQEAQASSCEWGGDVVVNGRKIHGLLKGFGEEEVTLETKDTKLNIKVGGSRFSLPFLSKEQFPQFVQEEGSVQFTLPASVFSQTIARAIIGSGQSLNSGFNGQCINLTIGAEELTFAATDEKKLSVVAIKLQNVSQDQQYSIPTDWLQGTRKILAKEKGDITLSISENMVTFQTATVKFTGRLIDQIYPAYASVLPTKSWLTTTFSRDDMEPRLRRLLSLTDRTSRRVEMDIREDMIGLTVSASDFSTGWESVAAEHEGPPLTIKINGFFLLEFLDEVPEGARVDMLTKAAGGPVGFNIEGDTSWQYLIMPLSA